MSGEQIDLDALGRYVADTYAVDDPLGDDLNALIDMARRTERAEQARSRALALGEEFAFQRNWHKSRADRAEQLRDEAREHLARIPEDWRNAGTALADMATRADRAEAAVARVKALHQPVPIYEDCDDDGCERADCFENTDGIYLHGDEKTGEVCDHCTDAYEEQFDYPCTTIHAIENGENDD